ncbi:hypothetical protein M231_03968 [Tremella mesenterica]|uniref:Protein yippee-like n=1 Tax=Tremella mesenterica TaxID=5217 RepID=A0A4Q1BMB9_TREME|nr:hypothetical protein M231_03968 [Tremella mesenterica]
MRNAESRGYKTTGIQDYADEQGNTVITGTHTVADLLCSSCDTSLGWMYIKAPNGDQRYKEGRFILEAAKIVKENNW